MIPHGLKLHRIYAQGSDGRIGNDLVEVKTTKGNNQVSLNLKRNFSKVLLVKITDAFGVRGKLIDRKGLTKVKGDLVVLDWDSLEAVTRQR